jgi:hypothetical protein
MDLKLDADGDLAIENGDLALVTGVDATVQFVRQRLQLFLSEWFLDESRGIDYFDRVFIRNPNPIELDSIFKTTIIESPGVLELLAFDMDIEPVSRTLTVTGRIRALDGEADFSVTIKVGG